MSAETVLRPALISGPGVYDDMPDEVYHSDPTPTGSLSRSGAKEILPPKTPAHFAHWRQHGRAAKREFDFGHAAHSVALGRGLRVHVVDAPTWNKKVDQEARKAAYARGEAPLLAREWQTVQNMAAALKRHPLAAVLLAPDRFRPEQSLFWKDKRTGVLLRSRPDLLDTVRRGRRFLIVDYKTAEDADDESFGKSSANYGYHLQEWFCCEGVRTLGVHPEPQMVWVVQEKRAPHLINVLQLDDEARALGRIKAQQAINIYARCQAEGRWPGYGDGVNLASLPRWATYGEDLAP